MFLLNVVIEKTLSLASNIFIVVWYESLPDCALPHWYDEPDHSQFCTSVVAFKVTPPSKDVSVVVCVPPDCFVVVIPTREPEAETVPVPFASSSLYWEA